MEPASKNEQNATFITSHIAMYDFNANYFLILQNAVQSLHRNNSQATIHHLMIYSRKANSTFSHTYVVISDGVL
jgi:hypothetical protein